LAASSHVQDIAMKYEVASDLELSKHTRAVIDPVHEVAVGSFLICDCAGAGIGLQSKMVTAFAFGLSLTFSSQKRLILLSHLARS